MHRAKRAVFAPILRVVSILGILVMVQGCASIVTGQNQVVSVDTPMCPAAKCKLQNEEGVFWVPVTPGTVSVNREYGDLTVTCSKPGYPDSIIAVSSSTKGMAFGNILFGGVIGAGVDMGTGAAYDYPGEIVSPLDCRTEAERASVSGGTKYGAVAAKFVADAGCGAPQFAFADAADEIYKTECKDARTGLVKCGAEGCIPLNMPPVQDGKPAQEKGQEP